MTAVEPATPTASPVAYRHLYLHVPFCARRCSYCDFSIVVRPQVPVREYLAGVEQELTVRRGARDAALTLDTLYLGGGTPSRLGAEGITELLAILRRFADVADDVEVTLEANPEDITPDAVRAWRDAGINRLSIGVQSFDDRVLQWMHRVHDAAMTERAVAIARGGGLDAYSLDLIFALPEMLERDWSADLERLLALAPDHVSLYGLTVEPHTPLGRWAARGTVDEAPEERYEAEFLEAHARLRASGFEHYEVSNFSQPGRRARHNSAYWRGVPYLGVGPSAHGYDGAARRWNVSAYTAWLAATARGEDPRAGEEILTADNRIAEAVYLGLRTTDGLVLAEEEVAAVAPWISAGWMEWIGEPSARHVRCTPLGWLRLDTLAAALTSLRSHS